MSLILDCYKDILTAFSLVTDEDGLISQKHPTGTLVPLKVEGRRLVLPTKEWQRKGYGEDYQPFHPGCEVMAREGTSPVMQMLQRQAKAMLAHTLVTMGNGLLQVAVDKDTHKDLPLECSGYLKKLSNADQTTKDLMDKLIGAAVKKNRLLTVYLKNGGTYEGKKVNRSAIIRFPILEDLLSDVKDPLGVTIPKKQRPTLVALFQLLIPNGDKPEEYSFGTTARVAPYLISLLNAYHKITSVFNALVEQYAVKLHIPAKPVVLYEMDVVENITKHYQDIPPYSGNEGSTNDQPTEANETVEVAKKAAAKLHAAPKQLATQVSRNAAVAPQATSTAVATGKPAASMADFMNATNPQPVANGFGVAPAQPMNTGFTPIGFSQPAPGGFQPNGFNQAMTPGFSQPTNPFAPAPIGVPNWMGGGPTHQAPPANPFMSATPNGVAMATGNTGLL